MARARSQFVCQQCGYSQSQWAGKCPSCGTWNSLVETTLGMEATRSTQVRPGKVYKLSEVKADQKHRLKTGETELDNVLGGGLVPGMVVLVAGEPGIGKSTLLTQVALKTSGQILYVCGEESASQVALRVGRLEGKVRDAFLLLESTDADDIVAKIEEVKPVMVIVDSIQTLQTSDLTGTAASVGQVRECAQRIVRCAKSLGIPVFMVGHVTKEGSIAGPAVLMHVVDTVLWFEGERSSTLRLIRAVKNRFGPTDEMGVFEMKGEGLVGVGNPSQILLAQRVKNVPGSVVSVIMEGTRPFLVEIQALVSPSQLAIPRRIATGIDYARIQMLVAVLSQRAGLALSDQDVYINVTGGVKLADRGADLAVCLAIASSFLNKSLDSEVAAVGEVGLLGEVRKVSGLDKRVKEAKKLGYKVASAESGKSVSAAIKKLLG
ncbi:MAG: DNA repair protein RadA [bacterium]|nr:DNA repair protein RadA [bacterium]